jgi:hypothetical protein
MIAFKELNEELKKEKQRRGHGFLGKYDEIRLMEEIRELY